MKLVHRIVPILALALAAAIATPAMARDNGPRDRDHRSDSRGDHRGDGRRDDRRGDRDYGRNDRRDDRYDRRDNRYDNRYDRGPDRVVYAPRYNPPPRVVYRHGPPAHAYPRWNRGMRYDTRGYGPTYVVSDYRNYDLYAPPRGYHWRRDDRGEFLLVAIATGLIANVIFR